MRLLPTFYPLRDLLQTTLPDLRAGQLRQLTLWVAGTVAADSGCEAAVVLALEEAAAAAGAPVDANTIRQDLRDLLRNGDQKRTPQGTELSVAPCFARLLAQILALLAGRQLALAIDATHFHDHTIAIVISVLYRSRAIPVAWDIRTATTKGAWMPVIIALLAQLAPVVPASYQVLVLADEGLFSPALFRAVRERGWAPLLRGHLGTVVTTVAHGRQCAAHTLVAGPGHAWVGRVHLFKTSTQQLRVTLVVVWGAAHDVPWVLITALAPRAVGVYWYALRAWIECGFRDLKAFGWQWERTQRRACARVSRHWLVLALATLWALAAGTVAEEASRQRRPRAWVHPPATPPPARTGQRTVSVFQRGRQILRLHLAAGTLPSPWWLLAEAWPEPPATLVITYPDDPDPTTTASSYTSLPQ
jgi:Transposase DDE domain